MRLTFKRSVVFLSVITVLAVILAVGAFAAEYPASGWVQMYGEDGTTPFEGTDGNLMWTVDQVTEGENTEVVLTITGTDTTLTFNSKAAWNAMGKATVPWWSYVNEVTKIVIEAPITDITQACAFNKMSKVHTVVFPDTVIKLKEKVSMVFAGMSALTCFGPEGTPANTIDLRNFRGNTSQGFESSSKDKTITVLMPYSADSPVTSTKNFCNGTDVTFKVIAGSPSETFAKSLQAVTTGSYVLGSKVKIAYYDTSDIGGGVVTGGVEGQYAYTLDTETGELVITNEYAKGIWAQFNTDLEEFQNFKNIYGVFVKNATVEYFQKISFGKGSATSTPLFAGMKNLEKVTFAGGQRMQNGLPSAGSWFSGCAALKSVTFGGELVDGVADLSGMSVHDDDSNEVYLDGLFSGCENITEVVLPDDALMNKVFADTFSGCKNLAKVNLGPAFAEIEAGAFADCPNVTIDVVESSYAHTWAQENDVKFNIVKLVPDVVTGENKASDTYGTANYKWELDTKTGVLTIEPTEDAGKWNELKNAGIDAFKAEYRDYVKSIVVGTFSKIQTTGEESIFAGYPNLVSFQCLKAGIEIQESSNTGLFENNPKLTTVAFGDKVTNGVVDISGIRKMASSEPKAMFKGCTSIKTVVFRSTALDDGKKGEAWGPTIIDSMFEGCTALESITIPAYITEISEKAFAGCTALKTVNLTGSAPAVDVTAFENVGKTVAIIALTDEDVEALRALEIANVKVMKKAENPLVFEGYSVRLKDYNGLRGVFSFTEAEVANLEMNGYTVKEYGALVATAENAEKYGFDLQISGNSYVTTGEKIVKSEVYKNGYIVNKTLSTSTDDVTNFALSLINISDANYKTDVVMKGYVVLADADGNVSFMYTDVTVSSLYDASIGMYKDGIITAENGGIAMEVIATGVVTLKAGDDFAVVEGQTDLEGNAIGETFVFENVPVVKQSVVVNPEVEGDKGTMSYEVSDVTVTLYEDGENYVAVYSGEGVIPGTSRWGANIATVNQLSSYYLNNRGKGYAFPAAVPNPALTNGAFGKVKTVIISEGITGLGDELFNDMGNLKKVVFPESLESAEKGLFQSSGIYTAFEVGAEPVEGVVDVSCIEKLTTSYLFNGCKSVVKARLPGNITQLGNQTFQNCIALVSVACGSADFVEGVADFSNTSLATIGNTVFSKVNNIGTVKLPATVTAISMNVTEKIPAVFNGTGSAVLAEGAKLVVETPSFNEAVNSYASDETLGANIEYKYAE